MILNEDYYRDLEITDDDIDVDDTLDDEYPLYGTLTVEELHKLPEQYSLVIRFWIDNKSKTKTSLLPKLFNRLDDIFDIYGIEHSEYILTLSTNLECCDTKVKFENYSFFSNKYYEDNYNTEEGRYGNIFICIYVKYPKFSFKRAIRFVYTMTNLFYINNCINTMVFIDTTDHRDVNRLDFHIDLNEICLVYNSFNGVNLCSDELTEIKKRNIYDAVIHYFFGNRIRIPYKSLERDVPLKPIIPK